MPNQHVYNVMGNNRKNPYPVDEIINEFNRLIAISESYGYPIKLNTDSESSLCIYYHDDYPNMILVDKGMSK